LLSVRHPWRVASPLGFQCSGFAKLATRFARSASSAFSGRYSAASQLSDCPCLSHPCTSAASSPRYLCPSASSRSTNLKISETLIVLKASYLLHLQVLNVDFVAAADLFLVEELLLERLNLN